MKHSPERPSAAWLCLLVLPLGCRAGAAAPEPNAAVAPASLPEPPSWTRAFEREALLVADEVLIEGPPGLLEHVASRQDPGRVDYRVETVSAGLLQQALARPGAGAVEIRAQLDNWTIVALRRLTVLERPGETPVHVQAAGNAWFHELGGSDQRGAILSFAGARPR